MILKVEKTPSLTGVITPPSSKSHSVRALLIATMAKGMSELTNVLESDDTTAALEVIKSLGAQLAVNKNKSGGLNIEVQSAGVPLATGATDLYTGNSGITTRFVLPMLGLRANTSQPIILNCGEQMKQRPLQPLITALNDLGMNVASLQNNGTCPLSVSGVLQGGKITVDGITSQYLSALLLSLPLAPEDSEITVTNLHERPYVEMTMRWLDELGIKYEWRSSPVIPSGGVAAEVEKSLDPLSRKGQGIPPLGASLGRNDNGESDVFTIHGRQKYRSFKKTIPGDFSSASYLLTAGVLVPGEVTIQGLDMNDPQGDKKLISILQEMGADLNISENSITIRGEKKLQGIKIDCNEIPDLVPTLAVLGTAATGKTELMNVPQARLKETDRLRSMAEGLARLGARVEEKPDGLVIYESKLHGAEVKGYNDHRTVMAFAVAGLIADGATTIDTAEAINKTFPDFIKTINALGGKLILSD